MSESSNDRVGQRVSNYELVRFIGHGGFADVYLGEHIYLKTQAAVKILHIRAADTDQSDILNEARTIAHLEHPHIIRLFEYGVEDGYPFLIMSYAARGSLRHTYPKGTRLPTELAITYTQQVASALDYAHKSKLIHRDVKPENMLIGQNDQVLLSDFGLVMMAQTSRSQSSDDLAGTVAYMAPEQLRGRPRFASDQYALGVVVYEWLCGKRPFNGSFAEVASQQMLEPPPSLCEMLPGLTPEIEQVVLKALAKNPTDRFESVEDFAHALSSAHNNLSCSPIHLGPLSTTPQTNDHSLKLQSSNIDNTTQPLLTLSSLKADSNATIGMPAYGLAASTYDLEGSDPLKIAQVTTGKQVSRLSASVETITPDVALPVIPALPTFQLVAAPYPAQAAPTRKKKSLKSILIVVVLLLVLSSSIMLGLNKLAGQQRTSINTNQGHELSSTATTSGRMVRTTIAASPTNTPPMSIPTTKAMSTKHTLIPQIVSNIPTPTSVPAARPAVSTPTNPTLIPTESIPTPEPTPDPSSTPTPDPNSIPTPDTNATPDPNLTPTPDLSSTPTPDISLLPGLVP